MFLTLKCVSLWVSLPFGLKFTSVHCHCGRHQRPAYRHVYTLSCTDTQTDLWIIYIYLQRKQKRWNQENSSAHASFPKAHSQSHTLTHTHIVCLAAVQCCAPCFLQTPRPDITHNEWITVQPWGHEVKHLNDQCFHSRFCLWLCVYSPYSLSDNYIHPTPSVKLRQMAQPNIHRLF